MPVVQYFWFCLALVHCQILCFAMDLSVTAENWRALRFSAVHCSYGNNGSGKYISKDPCYISDLMQPAQLEFSGLHFLGPQNGDNEAHLWAYVRWGCLITVWSSAPKRSTDDCKCHFFCESWFSLADVLMRWIPLAKNTFGKDSDRKVRRGGKKRLVQKEFVMCWQVTQSVMQM